MARERHPAAVVMFVILVVAAVQEAVLRGSWSSPTWAAEVEPAATISLQGFTFVVPPPGHGVYAVALQATGGQRGAGVRTLRDGTVVTTTDSASANPAPGTPIDACADKHYALNQSHWTSTMAWRYRIRSTAKGLKRLRAARVLQRAASNIVTGRNDCGMADQIGAKQHYLGTTTLRPNVGTSSNCLHRDGKSVVGFGAIDPRDLGLTCWWTVGGSTVEADMKLNNADYEWTTKVGSACRDRWSLEAVATHEFGHAFGLNHVSAALDANQTMSPVILPCQNSQATLGRGDVLGLRSRY